MNFRLDKTYFRESTFDEADDQTSYWKSVSEEERLQSAVYLILTSYRLSEFPPMDKTLFSCRKLVYL